MKMNAQSILKEITPPIAQKLVSKVLSKKTNHNSVEPLGVEKPAEYYEQLGTGNHLLSHYSESHYYPTWLVISDYLLRQNCASILDIGCGPGQFANLLMDNGVEKYTGIDFSKKRIERAKQLCPDYTFVCKDVFEEGLIESFDYDAVVMTEFLEHINEDIAVIQRITPGTRVVGTVPSYGGSAHVRKFQTPESVIERYGDILENMIVRSVVVRQRGDLRLQMFDGVRK